MAEAPYTRQEFLDTARRRVNEARALLDYPSHQKHRDGAVTLALLAAECSLKALLMHGYQLNTTDDANDSQRNRWFKGVKGHNLQTLWVDQHASLRNLATDQQSKAISILNKADPYAYRYGKMKPRREHAEPFVEYSECLVKWMKEIVGISP
jgi:hypothetical protein